MQKNNSIICSIHKGILENPFQCRNCNKYCCKDCIDNYKYCPFCKNEKNYYPNIKINTDIKSRFQKCKNCEIYFERIYFNKHKCEEKKAIHCYFCNFVGTKEKFFEHLIKKHKKILINDLKNFFGNNNQNNINYTDLYNDFFIENSDDLYNYNKQKNNDFLDIRHINSFEDSNNNFNNYFDCNNKINNLKSTKNKDGKKNFIFDKPNNNSINNSDNDDKNYNNNNKNNYNNINNNNINEINNIKNNDNKFYNDINIKNTIFLVNNNGYYYCNKQKDFKCKCCEDNICKKGNCMCGSCQKENCKNNNFERKCLINKYGKKSIFNLGKFVCYFDFGNGKKCNGINYVCPGCQSLLENRIHYLDEKTFMETQIIIDYNSNF